MKLVVHILELRNAIARTERALQEYRENWAGSGGGCCPGCMYGQEWTDLYAKLRRQVEWMHVLETKLWRAMKDPYAPLPRLFWSEEM